MKWNAGEMDSEPEKWYRQRKPSSRPLLDAEALFGGGEIVRQIAVGIDVAELDDHLAGWARTGRGEDPGSIISAHTSSTRQVGDRGRLGFLRSIGLGFFLRGSGDSFRDIISWTCPWQRIHLVLSAGPGHLDG